MAPKNIVSSRASSAKVATTDPFEDRSSISQNYRGLIFIAALYGVAIAYERVVEVDVFKPYRIVGAVLFLATALSVRPLLDRVGFIGILFVLAGILPGLTAFFNDSIYRRDDKFIDSSLISLFNLATYIALVSVVRSRRGVFFVGFCHAMAMLAATQSIALEARAADGPGRIYGDFTNPATTAISILFMCLVLVSMLRTSTAARWLTQLGATGAAICISMYSLYISSVSGSRSGTASVLMGMGVYIFMISGRMRAFLVGCLVLSASAVVVMDTGVINSIVREFSDENILLKRLEESDDSAHRFYLWRSGFDAFLDTYGIGTGISRYPELHREYFAKYASLSDVRWLDFDLTLHNDYVVALVEHGVIGLALLIYLGYLLYRNGSTIDNMSTRAIAVSVLVAMAVNGYSHVGMQSFNYWFYFALLIAWRTAEDNERSTMAQLEYRRGML